MKTKIELLPCPFCGGEAEIERIGNSRQSSIINCTDCSCTLESNENPEATGTDWNTRAESQELTRLRKENERLKLKFGYALKGDWQAVQKIEKEGNK